MVWLMILVIIGGCIDWNRDLGSIETTGMQPTLARQLMEIYCFVTKIYPATAMVLFFLFCFVLSQQLNGVKHQIELLSITDVNYARKALSKL